MHVHVQRSHDRGRVTSDVFRTDVDGLAHVSLLLRSWLNSSGCSELAMLMGPVEQGFNRMGNKWSLGRFGAWMPFLLCLMDLDFLLLLLLFLLFFFFSYACLIFGI